VKEGYLTYSGELYWNLWPAPAIFFKISVYIRILDAALMPSLTQSRLPYPHHSSISQQSTKSVNTSLGLT